MAKQPLRSPECGSMPADEFDNVALQVQNIVIGRKATAAVGGTVQRKRGASRPPPVAESREASEWQQQGDWRACCARDDRAAVATGTPLTVVDEIQNRRYGAVGGDGLPRNSAAEGQIVMLHRLR